jgi:hypothetical protein
MFTLIGIAAFYCLMYVVHTRKHSDRERMDHEIWTDLHVLRPLNMKKRVKSHLSVYVWIDGWMMDVHLVRA